MEEAMIDVSNLNTENHHSEKRNEKIEEDIKDAKSISSNTVTICKKSFVVPDRTMVLDIKDIIYYNENKSSFQNNKKSPYLIYLSTEFKNSIRKRNKIKNIKIFLIVLISISFTLILFGKIRNIF